MDLSLTKLTDAGGCGCKIPPNILREILSYSKPSYVDNNIIVDNEIFDDAAVYKINEKEAIVSTLDFFSPIVDDPFVYGQIAAANSISDIYAMGGKPLWALSILGLPIKLLDASIGRQIIEGANSICENAKISIIGGHSINNPQPIFGLSVNGVVNVKNVKKITNAQVGDYIFLTKPIGGGILSTATKLGKIEKKHYDEAVSYMTMLNSFGTRISSLSYVNAVTDITGFGVLGHLIGICNGSKVSAELNFDTIKLMNGVDKYIKDNIITSGGKRNQLVYEKYINCDDSYKKVILSDPQTNGGLLITISENFVNNFIEVLSENDLIDFVNPIGKILEQNQYTIKIQ